MRTIKTVTREFGKAYERANKINEKKAKLQEEFFQVADAEIGKRRLAQQTITMPEVTTGWEKWLKLNYPGWRFVSWKSDNLNEMIIEEDPSFMKFTYPNPDDGFVYGRTIQQGSPSLDDERLRKERPEFWDQISAWPEPWLSLVRDAMVEVLNVILFRPENPTYNIMLDDMVDNFLTARGVQKTLKDINTLTSEELAILQEYMVPGPVSTRLVKPRPAKEDELEESK